MRILKQKSILLIVIFTMTVAVNLYAHEGHEHPTPTPIPNVSSDEPSSEVAPSNSVSDVRSQIMVDDFSKLSLIQYQ